jgi:site-specific DNA-methyltransferase (adenine-specific)
VKPYYQDEAVTIYNGDALEILPQLSGMGAVVTDPPYSSGGAFRGDRSVGVVSKYVHTGVAAYRPEFAGDNRDQRSFLAWSMLWMNAARVASIPGSPIACFIDWRQLPVLSDAIQAGGWTWRGVAVWSKKFGRPTAGRFSSACEFVVWGSHGPMQEWDSYPPGIFEASPPSGEAKDHIAQKPAEVMKWVCRIAPPEMTGDDYGYDF